MEAVDEAILTAERAGVRLQVSHLVPRPGAPDGALARSIEHIDRAAERGLDVAFDVHTRLFGFTNLAVALPRWVVDGGPDAIRAVLRDRRDELAGHRSIVDSFAHPRLGPRVHHRCAGHAGGRGPEPGRAGRRGRAPGTRLVFDVLAAHADRVDEPMAIGLVVHGGPDRRGRGPSALCRRARMPRPSARTGRSPGTSSTAPTPGPPGPSRRSSASGGRSRSRPRFAG